MVPVYLTISNRFAEALFFFFFFSYKLIIVEGFNRISSKIFKS